MVGTLNIANVHRGSQVPNFKLGDLKIQILNIFLAGVVILAYEPIIIWA